jgi:hypothetical protein
MNEKQVKDLLDFLLVVINKFDERYHYMRVEIIERLETIAARQINFQEEIKKMFSDAEKNFIKALDDETTRIANFIADLVAGGGDKDDPEFMAALSTSLDQLRKVGTKPPVVEPPVEGV